jgi:hypothetical protein
MDFTLPVIAPIVYVSPIFQPLVFLISFNLSSAFLYFVFPSPSYPVIVPCKVADLYIDSDDSLVVIVCSIKYGLVDITQDSVQSTLLL